MGDEEPSHLRRNVVIGIVILLLVAAAVALWAVFAPEAPPSDPPLPTPTIDPGDGALNPVNTFPGQPTITGVVEGDQVAFTWVYDHQDDSDVYWVNLGTGQDEKIEDPTYTTDYTGDEVCLSVRVARASGAYAQVNPTKVCVS
jgi:hypothetical protein